MISVGNCRQVDLRQRDSPVQTPLYDSAKRVLATIFDLRRGIIDLRLDITNHFLLCVAEQPTPNASGNASYVRYRTESAVRSA